jgi:hypothetical protein
MAVVCTGGEELLQQRCELTLLIGIQRVEHAGERGIRCPEQLRGYPPGPARIKREE